MVNNMYSRIRELRLENNLSQEKVASLLNMSQTGYSKYETGENDIPTKVLIKLAKFYRTSIDYLLDLTDTKSAYPRKKKRFND